MLSAQESLVERLIRASSEDKLAGEAAQEIVALQNRVVRLLQQEERLEAKYALLQKEAKLQVRALRSEVKGLGGA